MLCSIAFSHSPEKHFLALLEGPFLHPHGMTGVSLAVFPGEDEFIHQLVLGISDNDLILKIVTHVLLTCTGALQPGTWLPVDLSKREVEAIGFRVEP